MRRLLVDLALATFVASLPAAEPGLRIVTRETFPAGVIETVDYILPDRARTDWRRPGHQASRIVRCDLQRDILLNHGHRTYSTFSRRAYSHGVLPALLFFGSPQLSVAKEPTLQIEITTVRTGEQKMMFGYPARRVITTTRHIPLDARGGAPFETEKIDGWYIDLDTRTSCDRSQITGRFFIATGHVVSGSSNASGPPEDPVIAFKEVGAPERGYPIETSRSSRIKPASADGRASETTFVTRKVVTELSSEPLDPALFEIPSGFRAESRLAEFGALWGEAWYTLRDLVTAGFR
jgi:hypothetical protein